MTERQASLIIGMTAVPGYREYIGDYFNFIRKMATAGLRKRNITQEDSGYYKGILQILDDMEDFPRQLSEALRPGKPSDNEDGTGLD
jgi:hypothetical protein